MLMPKRVKYRRVFRGKMRGATKGGASVQFGEFGLQATEACMDYKPSNRICTYFDDTLHETWR